MKNYVKGIYKRSIFKSDKGYVIGIFKVLETNEEEFSDYINKTITFTGIFPDLSVGVCSYFPQLLQDCGKSGIISKYAGNHKVDKGIKRKSRIREPVLYRCQKPRQIKLG